MVTAFFQVLLALFGSSMDTWGKRNRKEKIVMVEFGEQLKRAREEKGITQQTLADHLFVTRQAVSRWECGDRFPDLITAKKISDYFGVSLDTLLSGADMQKVVERSEIVERPIIKKLTMILFGAVFLSVMITVFDILLRLPTTKWGSAGEMPLSPDAMLYTAVNLVGLMIQVVIFGYGFYLSVRESLLPKKVGLILSIYYVSQLLINCLVYARNFFLLPESGMYHMPNSFSMRDVVLRFVILCLPYLFMALCIFCYFCVAKNWKGFPVLITIGTAMITVLDLYQFILVIGSLSETGMPTMNQTVRFVLQLSICALTIYQSWVLYQKRKHATLEQRA